MMLCVLVVLVMALAMWCRYLASRAFCAEAKLMTRCLAAAIWLSLSCTAHLSVAESSCEQCDAEPNTFKLEAIEPGCRPFACRKTYDGSIVEVRSCEQCKWRLRCPHGNVVDVVRGRR